MSWEALVSRLVKEIDDWLNFLYIINSIPPKIFHLTFYAWNVEDFLTRTHFDYASQRCTWNVARNVKMDCQIYMRTPMSKCDFNKVQIALRHGCSAVNLLHIFRTPFLKNTSGRLLLKVKKRKTFSQNSLRIKVN